MKLQAVYSLVLAMTLGGIVPAANAAVTPTASPLAPIARNGKTDAAIASNFKASTARVARAAICTEDISQIKFQEYYVDWSCWMNEVGDRWSTVFNAGYDSGSFHTDGPAFVQFTVKADGSVTGVSLAKSSGDKMCDRGQVEALVNCMPLPAFPVGSARKTVTLLYVWEYGSAGHFAKADARAAAPSRNRASMPDSYRMSVSGKTM